MKKIIILLIVFLLSCYVSSTIAQVSIDSSKSVTNGNTVTLYGYATFVTTPSASDYKVGFLFGESYNDISYIPMGSFSWHNPSKRLTFWTEVTNLGLTTKHYFHPYIQPKASISKFEVTGIDGSNSDIICEPVIESASGTLRGDIDEQLTFTIYMEDREQLCDYNYQWSYKLATSQEVYDTTSFEPITVDTSIVYNYPNDWSNIGDNLSSWTTPKLKSIHHMAKVKCRVFNEYGEDSKEGIIKVN